MQRIPEACRNLLPGSGIRCLLVNRYFRDVKSDRAVVHLVVIRAKLRLNAVNLIAHLGQSALNLDDIVQLLRLFQHFLQRSCLGLQSLLMRRRIHVVKRDVRHALALLCDIGAVMELCQKLVQPLLRNPENVGGAAIMRRVIRRIRGAVIAVAVVVDFTALDVSAKLVHRSLDGFLEHIKFLRLDTDVDGCDQLSLRFRRVLMILSILENCVLFCNSFFSGFLRVGFFIRDITRIIVRARSPRSASLTEHSIIRFRGRVGIVRTLAVLHRRAGAPAAGKQEQHSCGKKHAPESPARHPALACILLPVTVRMDRSVRHGVHLRVFHTGPVMEIK